MRLDGSLYPGLPAAIAAVHCGHPDRPDLHALAWTLLPRLPGKPRTSANLKEEEACSRLNPLEDVILTDPWLGMNTENAVNAVWSESDKSGLSERVARYRAAGVPVKWVVYGENDTGHIGIPLASPVVTGVRPSEQDKAMLRKLSLTQSYYVTGILGDRAAGLRGMTKNAFSPRWTTVVYDDVQPATLDEILIPLQALAKAEGWVAPKRRYRGDRKREPSPEGRNCALFDLVRWWAGDEAEKDGSAILAKAEEVNDSFANPLGHGEVASVARSITRFMTTRFDGRGQHKRIYHEELNKRQVSAGRATAAARAASRDGLIHAAVARIRARGEEPGQNAVAAEAGVSLRTVKRAWSEIFRFVNKVPLAPPYLVVVLMMHLTLTPHHPFRSPKHRQYLRCRPTLSVCPTFPGEARQLRRPIGRLRG